MFNWKEFEKMKAILSHSGGDRYKDQWGQHHISIRPKELLEWSEFIKDDLDFFTLIDIAGLDTGDGSYEIIYHLLNMGQHQRLNIHLVLNKGEVVPSIVRFFSNADWMEREQSEMLNIVFDVEKESLILPQGQKYFPLAQKSQFKGWPSEPGLTIPKTRYNPNKSEAPYPEENYQWRKYDLLSPQTLGNFECVVCFDPLKVVDSRQRIGFHHQGVEKLLGSKNIIQIMQIVDKLNLSAAPHLSISWAKTIEEMYRIKIPERAQAIRLIMIEMARIADHLMVLSSVCFESNQNEYRLFLNAREKIYELFEKYSGSRHGLGIARIGGVVEDLPYGWIVEYQTVSDIIHKTLPLIHRSLIGQTDFRFHLEGEAVNAQSILQWGVSGPAMRAAGLNYDLRKSQPFYFYQDIDFDIPVGIHGSTYDRYLIRYEEIFQSLRIITQVIDNLPLGETISELFNLNSYEVLNHFASLDHEDQWHYSAIESSSGESGFLAKFDENKRPQRIKMKTPSFSIAQALPVFIKGLREEQLSATLASLGINRWEMDR